MSIEEKLFTALTSSSPALRVYPDIAPQPAIYPLLVYTIVAGDDDMHLQGTSGIRRRIIQIDSYATSRLSATEQLEHAQELLLAATDFTVNNIDNSGAPRYDIESKKYRASKDYSIRYEQ